LELRLTADSFLVSNRHANDTNTLTLFQPDRTVKQLTTPQSPSNREELMKTEGGRIVDAARERNLNLRLLGAIAFQLHCPKYSYLTGKLRRALSDVDFAAYGSERKQLDKMMRDFGYADEPMITAIFGSSRMIWDNKSTGMHVDIFFDKLQMNHEINFDGRLELDTPTIPLADMLLEKMQIVHINEKDVVDTIMLLREHQVGGHAPETIDSDYIAKLLSEDWGFYYTVTTNLRNVEQALDKYPELTEADRADVKAKVQLMLQRLDKEPKSLGWRLRAKVGPKTKWYNEVEEVRR